MKLLDLFCGAGGAAMGYSRAGFDEIVGVDIKPQPRYPFKFMQSHFLSVLAGVRSGVHRFDFIHASPPCQHYTQMLNHGLTPRENHPDYIEETRKILMEIGLPFVIENVAGAPLINAGMLCGEMFDLRVTRHRFFECSFDMKFPEHPKHRGTGHRKQGDGGYYYRVYGHETGKKNWGMAMGIDWMKTPELAQAVPPAYTEFIGRRLIEEIKRLRVA